MRRLAPDDEQCGVDTKGLTPVISPKAASKFIFPYKLRSRHGRYESGNRGTWLWQLWATLEPLQHPGTNPAVRGQRWDLPFIMHVHAGVLVVTALMSTALWHKHGIIATDLGIKARWFSRSYNPREVGLEGASEGHI